MKVLPLHDIPPVRKPRAPVQITHSESPTLPYARRGTSKPRSRGPTLLEIVMVSLLLFVGGAVIVPRMVDRGEASGRHAAVKSDLSALEAAVGQFQADTGRLPTDAEGLDALLIEPSTVSGWRGPYIIHPARDVWGHPYIYRLLPSGHFEVRSTGPDGKANTADDIFYDCTPPQ